MLEKLDPSEALSNLTQVVLISLVQQLGHDMSDDIVRRHAVAGKPDDVRKRLSEYEEVGLDQLIVTGVSSAEELAPLLNSLAAIRD